ncbi:MAG: hypothetical protein NTZ16_01705 [Verrucomicrobia bacterium]|nr:hypothetical protein [Verrucomicrobiota bacterium]
MKSSKLPKQYTYAALCSTMEDAGWIGHSTACCVGNYGKEKLNISLKKSKAYTYFSRGIKPPKFNLSSAESMYLVFRDVNGKHPVSVLVNTAQGLVRALNGKNQQFSVGFIEDLKRGLRKKIRARL